MRLLASLLALALIVTLTFLMMMSLPGNPFDDEKGLPKETKEALIEHYGLGDPIHQQFGRYIQSLVRLDLGPSIVYKGTSVLDIIQKSFPVSLLLGIEALLLALSIGYGFGAFLAFKGEKVAWITLLFLSIPSFIMAALLKYIFAFRLGLFPSGLFDSFFHTILPALSLALAPAAFIARQVAHNFKEIYSQEYILAARAKGLNPLKIFRSYVLKNGTLPLLGYFGQLSTQILTGSFMVEKIFAIPGLGFWMVNAILTRDYPLIMGLTLLFSLMLLLLTTCADLLRKEATCA